MLPKPSAQSLAGFTDVDAFLRSIALVLRHQQQQAAAPGSSEGDAGEGASRIDGGSAPAAAPEAAEAAAGTDGANMPPATAAALLAQLAARAVRAGVAAAASRGWPAVAALLLPSVTVDGRSGWLDAFWSRLAAQLT